MPETNLEELLELIAVDTQGTIEDAQEVVNIIKEDESIFKEYESTIKKGKFKKDGLSFYGLNAYMIKTIFNLSVTEAYLLLLKIKNESIDFLKRTPQSKKCASLFSDYYEDENRKDLKEIDSSGLFYKIPDKDLNEALKIVFSKETSRRKDEEYDCGIVDIEDLSFCEKTVKFADCITCGTVPSPSNCQYACIAVIAELIKYYLYKKIYIEQLLIRYEKQKYIQFQNGYEYEISNFNTLKYADEASYQMALEILDKELIDSSKAIDMGEALLKFPSKICGEQDHKYTPMIRNNLDVVTEWGTKSCRNFLIAPNAQFPNVLKCNNCSAEFCIPILAWQIKFLRETGRENLIEELRKEGAEERENHKKGRPFNFEINEHALERMRITIRTAPIQILNKAIELLDKKRAELFNKLIEKDNGEEYIRLYMSDDWDGQAKTLDKVCIEGNNPKSNILYRGLEIDFFNNPNDSGTYINFDTLEKKLMMMCIVVDYYRRTQDDFDEIVKSRNELLSRFEEKGNVEGLSLIINLALNKNASSLYCILEGSKGSGKSEIVKQIAEALFQAGKIETTAVREVTAEQVAITATTTYNAYSEKDVKINQYPSGDYYSGHHFKGFEKNRLIVISHIDELFKEKVGDASPFRVNRFLQMLATFESDAYVIIESQSENTTQRFLSLNNSYKFLYGNNIIKCQDMTSDDIYEQYYNGLSDDIKSQIENKDQFESDFKEYLEFNKRFLPSWNGELANYLSNYSNIAAAPILPPGIYSQENTREKLDQMIGMKKVKQQVIEFENYISYQAKARAAGVNIEKGNMHMLFLGNPGTGKTTIARIIASLLCEIGVIEKDTVVEVQRKDLIAQYTGQTAPKTQEVINKAMGGVLFIDEAYSLCLGDNDDYGREAIATIIKAMEDCKDNLIVMFAGYSKEMHSFLNANSGIRSRIGYTFTFEDYSPDELTQILELSVKNQNLIIEDEAKKAVKHIFEYFGKTKDFGNGRFAKRLLQETIMNHSANFENKNWTINTLTVDDIPTIQELANTSDKKFPITLEELIGLSKLKEHVESLRVRLAFENKVRDKGINLPRGNSHMMFIGNPGTGKTTVARIIVDELYDAGVIMQRKLIEVSAQDLIAKYVGQSASRTQDIIDRAMGGVLFIDEAYSLISKNESNDFGQESLSVLIKAMEDNKESLVVIFAGYKQEMQRLIDANTGFVSRIGYTFYFDDYNASELTDIFKLKINKTGLSLGDGVEKKVKDVMQYFVSVPNFGNGRFAEMLSQMVYTEHTARCATIDDKEELTTITVDDIPDVDKIIKTMPNGQDMIDLSKITEEQNRRTSYHELGHAYITIRLFPDKQIERITIAAEGNGALGYVRHGGLAEYNDTAKKLKDQICVCMAGIASEKVFLDEYANGGSSDLEKATEIAKRMIKYFGMSKNGFAYNMTPDEDLLSEVNEILSEQFERAMTLINQEKDSLKEAADILCANKEISESELKEKLK